MGTRLDRTDLRILEILQSDGRVTNAELADRVALSPAPCLRRVQRLERDGVIAGYGARVTPTAVGLGLQAFVRVQLETHDSDHIQRFADLVGDSEEVVACWSLTGEMDYLLQVAVADLEHYNTFIMSRLLREGGVRDINSSFVLGTIKGNRGWPLGQVEGG